MHHVHTNRSRVARTKIFRLFVCPQNTESSVIIETDSSADRTQNLAAATATTKVSHFYRQFSKKKKTKKSKSQDATFSPTASSLSLSAAEPPLNTTRPPETAWPPETTRLLETTRPPETVRPPEVAKPSEPASHSSGLCEHPALAASVVLAPPWLVADYFVSEHIAHEHVSVVPVPDHADPVPVKPGDVSPPPAAAASSDPTTLIECSSVARATYVSYYNNDADT